MPHSLHELADALGYMTEKAEQGRPPRNRPISLYATPYETLILTETAAVCATTAFVWSDGSTGCSIMQWGIGMWAWT